MEQFIFSNAVLPANDHFKKRRLVKTKKGFKIRKGIPSKGGNTTNASIPEWMFKKELEYLKAGGELD